MNIFWLHRDVQKSARCACDQHIVKMITEHTQQMCTALHFLGVKPLPMRSTHAHHPCVKWLIEDFANFFYLIMLNAAYHAEYQRRYGDKIHGGYQKMLELLKRHSPPEIRKIYRRAGLDTSGAKLSDLRMDPAQWITIPPQALPQELKSRIKNPSLQQVVRAYRRFYKERKARFARYSHSPVPHFMRSSVGHQHS